MPLLSRYIIAFIYFCTNAVVNYVSHMLVLCRSIPSTISSESSVKNSLRGGLLGLFKVLSSCWIFVDTLLLTGTPEERHTYSYATWRGLFAAPQHHTLHLTISESAALHSRTRKKRDFFFFFFFGVQGLIGHNAFLEMKRSTRRWQQDEESTVRKIWGDICWEDSFWEWMLVSLHLFL